MTVEIGKERDEIGAEAGTCVVAWSVLGLVSMLARQCEPYSHSKCSHI